jgi:hypothetical protein
MKKMCLKIWGIKNVGLLGLLRGYCAWFQTAQGSANLSHKLQMPVNSQLLPKPSKL